MTTRRVEVLPEAIDDQLRLVAFLAPRGEAIAYSALSKIETAVRSLDLAAERGRRALTATDFRELLVPFGSGAYIIQYRVEGDRVLVARIFHSLEDRA